MSTDSLDDLMFLNHHKFNVTLTIIIATKSQSLAYEIGNWTRKPFNYAIYMENGQDLQLIKDYFSLNDPSWKKTRLTFMVIPPYIIPPNARGQFRGTAFDIWAEIGEKLNLDLSFSYQPSYDKMFHQVRS